MKRLALVTGMALMLVGASQAAASPIVSSGYTPASSAKATQSFAISFTVKTRDKKPVKVTKFNYGNNCKDPDVGPGCTGDDGDNTNNVPVSCQSPSPTQIGTYLNGYLPPMKVRKGEFGSKNGLNTDGNTMNGAEATVIVNGEFRNHNKEVVGDLRIKGAFPPYSNCDSTKLKWKAS